jgi:orotate phosphoribosyltransferase
MDAWEELRQIIRQDSLLSRPEGYLLASGRRSPYYVHLNLDFARVSKVDARRHAAGRNE